MEDEKRLNDSGMGAIPGLMAVIAFILITAALKSARSIVMPVTIGFFLAVLLSPIQDGIARRVPGKLKWLGTVLALLVLLSVFALIAGGLWFSVTLVGQGIDVYVQRVQEVWSSGMGWMQSRNIPLQPARIDFYSVARELASYIGGGTLTLVSVVATISLVLFLMVLMLIEEERWRDKVRNAFGRNAGAAMDTVGAVTGKLRRFLLMHTLLSLTSGVATGVLLWALDIDFAFVWGFLTFLLNFIPYIGSVIAAIPPILLALLQHGPLWSLLVLGGLILINLINDNYLIPLVEGHAVQVSPLVILVAVVYWGWVWGVIGALLATPLTATIMVIFAHVPPLRPAALLMSGVSDEKKLREAAGLKG